MAEPQEWEVEQILKRGKVDGIIHYYVKWKGYPLEESTWEPLKNLDNCAELVRTFEMKHNSQIRPSNKDGRNQQDVTHRVFEQQGQPSATQSPKVEDQHIEGTDEPRTPAVDRDQEEAQPEEQMRRARRRSKSPAVIEPKDKSLELQVNQQEDRRPVRRRQQRRMMVDSDDSSSRRKSKGAPSKRFKANLTEEVVARKASVSPVKTVRWADEMDSKANHPPESAELRERSEPNPEEVLEKPREPSPPPKDALRIDKGQVPSVDYNDENTGRKLEEEEVVAGPQSKRIDLASGENQLLSSNRARLERYQFCDKQLTRSKRTLLLNIMRRKDKQSRIRDPLKILDLSEDSGLLAELPNVHEREGAVELKVVMALVKVPYSWKALGREREEGSVVLAEVGMLGRGTWMALVGMIA